MSDERPAAKDYILHVGSEHYPTYQEYLQEAREMGVSRRLPSHCLPGGLALLGSRIWLAHGLGRAEKKGEDGEPRHGVVFGWFRPSAIQFIAGPDGQSKYADVIADLRQREPAAEVVLYEPELVERPRKCGFRKIGGTYVVAQKPGSTESPITELIPPQPFVGHSFRGMLELTPEQVGDLEAGRGLSTLVDRPCMECGEPTPISPSTVLLAETALRQLAKGRVPKFVLRCPGCRERHRKEEYWNGRARGLAEHLGKGFAGASLASEFSRRSVAEEAASYMRRGGDVDAIAALLSEEFPTAKFEGWTERFACAATIARWVRERIEAEKTARAA